MVRVWAQTIVTLTCVWFLNGPVQADNVVEEGSTSDGLPLYVQIPDGIDLTAKRIELLALVPKLPSPVTKSALVLLGQEIDNFEVFVIKGFQDEIKSVCDKAKSFERTINSLVADMTISRAEHAYHTGYIADLRRQCLPSNRETSSYWQLEASLRRQNSLIFAKMQRERAACDQKQACFEN